MDSDHSAELESALTLLRRGRYADLVELLERSPAADVGRRSHAVRQALLADALQRTGHNDRAKLLASQNSRHSMAEVSARCHFVLGNVYRERGEIAKAIEHFQISGTSSGSDTELACWAQLRLLGAVAEFNGVQGAIARLGEVRQALTRFGDARPFAALHLWFAETECTRGHLLNARRHLGSAVSLLGQVQDVWLQGYLAINSSVVSYHCAEFAEARRWAEVAINCAEVSGHRGALRAANANLGHIEFSQGHLTLAHDYFQVALRCCETGSASEVAVLDSIAQVKLQLGDLSGCREMLQRVEHLGTHEENLKYRYYRAWALQTKLQLLLQEGKKEEARKVAERLRPTSGEVPQPRVRTVSYLLAAETLTETGEVTSGARMLQSVLSPTIQIPLDLFAQMESVTGKALKAVGANDQARIHFARAIRTFDAVGHSTGRSAAAIELADLPPSSTGNALISASRRSLDRLRALIDTRTQPELFGREAVSFLEELGCADAISLIVANSKQVETTKPIVKQGSSPTVCINVSSAVAARKGVTLTFSPHEDSASIITALEFQRVIEQIAAIEQSDSPFADSEAVWAATDWSAGDGVLFAAEPMLAILKVVSTIAPTDISVLITGETGVGKEIVAKSIHKQSSRAAMPFLAFNCAAVPKELLESQLFGYRRGAFSGASEPFQGVVRAANGGTLLLDEIGELSIDGQAKLLRFLELGEVHPIGEAVPTKVNVRMLFATNDNLEKAVKEHRFREDLFYRLNVVPLKIPPLRERREEIPLLVNLFAKRFAREFSKEPAKFSSDAMELLVLYSWPGNVRQLANEIRRIAALTESAGYVTAARLSPEIAARERDGDRSAPESTRISISLAQTLENATALLEREMLEHALRDSGGCITDAAHRLGLSRKGLYLKRRRLGLSGQSQRAS